MENYRILFSDGSSASPSSLTMANHRSYLQANDVITTKCENLDAKEVSESHEVKVGKIGDNKGMVRKHKYAFQTRSQVDILDDGYRWRKYGQKTVQNSKFPRYISSLLISFLLKRFRSSIWFLHLQKLLQVYA